MAIAFRSSANTTYASRTNTTVTAPAGIANDDILVLFGLTGGGADPTATMTPPAGFSAVSLASGTNPTTVVGSGPFYVRMWCWWKRAASEAGNYTITHSSASSQGACLAISGGLTSGTPIDAATSRDENTGGTTSTGDAVTTTVANTLLVFFGHDWGDTTNNLTAPSGMTERIDVAPIIYAATEAIAATGSTGTRTMTNNSSAGSTWATFMVAIQPDAGGGAADHPASKRFGGVPGMAFPGRGNVWAPYRRLIWPGHRILRPA